MYKISKLTTEIFQENIWFISNKNNDVVIIDPGAIEVKQISAFLNQNQLNPIAILNTHGHPDHIAGVVPLQQFYDLPFYIHEQEKGVLDNLTSLAAMIGMRDLKIPMKKEYLKERKLKLHNFNFEIIHTPGHTPGSICIKFGQHLISGDTLFKGSIGRVDLPGGSMQQMKKSIRILKKLEASLMVYPGHGSTTRIAEEIEQNPYF